MLFLAHREEICHPMWIQLHTRVIVCTNVPHVLLYSTTSTTPPADSPHHQHPPPPLPSYGSSASRHASSSYGCPSSCHSPQPATCVGVHTSPTTLPLPNACPSTNSLCCPPTTNMRSTMHAFITLLRCLPSTLLQEAIWIDVNHLKNKRTTATVWVLYIYGLMATTVLAIGSKEENYYVYVMSVCSNFL